MSISLHWPWRRAAPTEPRDLARDVAHTAFGGGDDEPAPWVTVYNAATLEEAHVVKGALAAEDIPALLRYESVGRLYGTLTLGGVDVQVPRSLEDRAHAVLDEDDEPSPPRPAPPG
jgi:hypothetical protein